MLSLRPVAREGGCEATLGVLFWWGIGLRLLWGYNFCDGPIQRCAVHRIRSILERVPKAYRESVKKSLHEIFHAEDEAAARRMADEFVDKRRNPVRLDHQVSVGPA